MTRASWTIAATRPPSRSIARHAAARAGRGQLHGPAAGVHEALVVGQPVDELERGVAESACQLVAQLAPARRLAHARDQLAHGAALDHPRPDQRRRGTCTEPARTGPSWRSRRRPASRCEAAAGLQHHRDDQQDRDRDARGVDRHQEAPLAGVARRQRRTRITSTAPTSATPSRFRIALIVLTSVSLASTSKTLSGQSSQSSSCGIGEQPEGYDADGGEDVARPRRSGARRRLWSRPLGKASSRCRTTRRTASRRPARR